MAFEQFREHALRDQAAERDLRTALDEETKRCQDYSKQVQEAQLASVRSTVRAARPGGRAVLG